MSEFEKIKYEPTPEQRRKEIITKILQSLPAEKKQVK